MKLLFQILVLLFPVIDLWCKRFLVLHDLFKPCGERKKGYLDIIRANLGKSLVYCRQIFSACWSRPRLMCIKVFTLFFRQEPFKNPWCAWRSLQWLQLILDSKQFKVVFKIEKETWMLDDEDHDKDNWSWGTNLPFTQSLNKTLESCLTFFLVGQLLPGLPHV